MRQLSLDWVLDAFTLSRNTQLEALRVVFRSEPGGSCRSLWLTQLACSVPAAFIRHIVLDVQDVKETHLGDIDFERFNTVFSKPEFSRLWKVEVIVCNYREPKKDVIEDALSRRLGTLASRRLLQFSFPRHGA